MSSIPEALLKQFPSLPELTAQWAAFTIEPIMGSGERITFAVCGSDGQTVDGIRTLSIEVLRAIFQDQAEAVNSFIEMGYQAAIAHFQNDAAAPFQPPLSGLFMGKLREGRGDSLQDVLMQGVSLSSGFCSLNSESN